MQIKDVRVTIHSFQTTLPLMDKPRGGSTRVICEIETAEGHVGIGMSGSFLAHGVKAIVLKHLKPAIIGMDARDVEAIHAKLWPIISERGTQRGANLQALSCVDLAIWDAIGKMRNETVARLMGGARKEVPVYFTYGFGVYDKDQLVQAARDLIDQGHKRLKILVGVAESIVEDAARVRHVRKAFGDDIMLAMDANESLSADQAVRLARMVEDLDIAWFEDPIMRTDAANMANLRLRTTIPISGGQMDGHSSRFREWLEAGALDILMPNGLYNGGMTEVRRVAALAQAYNKPLSDAGGGGIYCLHHVAGFAAGTFAERHMGVEDGESKLFVNLPKPVRGMLAVPDAPGFGFTLNKDFLKETLVTD
jgi:L-rhamnonate dehydratase